MKTIHKLFLIATIALGLGFVACSDSDVVSPGDNDSKVNTHMSVTLKLAKGPSTRAVDDKDYNYIGDWAGKDKISNVSIYLIDGEKVTRYPHAVDKYTFDTTDPQNVILRPKLSAAIKTTEGPKTVYVVVNENAIIQNALDLTSASAFKDSYEAATDALVNSYEIGGAVVTSASSLAVVNDDDDEIVMTTLSPDTIVVLPNVSAPQAIGDLSPNQASVSVERTVARVLVTLATDFKSEIIDAGNVKIGTVSNVHWVLAQGESKLFIQRKNNWATPSFEWVPTQQKYWDSYITGTDSKYDYSGLFENYEAATQFGGIVLTPGANPSKGIVDNKNAGGIGGESVKAGRFILPTTHKYGVGDVANYKKGNTAYVLVRAKFTPTTLADDGELTGGTFYLGANSKFYSSAANAIDPAKGGVAGQTVAKYVGGKVLYYAWVNPDAIDTKKWYNSPVLRNNIYHIHITGFKTIGTNWNPLFPEDPDNPKGEPVDPDDPDGPKKPLNPDPKPNVPGVDEPVNPINPEDPLTTPETWMSVKVTVLPWKVHSYDIEL